MENPSSPLDTLRQLKEMLDAGALTPTEFEALKQRLVFAPAAPAALAAEAAAPVAYPIAPVPPLAGEPAPALPTAALPNMGPTTAAVPPELFLASTEPAMAAEPAAMRPAPELISLVASVPLAAAPLPANEVAETLPEPKAEVGPAQGSSSLGLVLAIGAVLVFLAVVAYLGFTRPASEHISSTSQTAADSVATAIETGPQVAPLPSTVVAPETVRVVPANPAPARPSRAEREQQAAAVRDSAAAPAATDSTARQ